MKSFMPVLTALTPFTFQLSTALAQSTAFTYQGRLAANGLPYTGLAEMQFALFDTLSGGTALASNSPTVVSVNVSAGLFTTSLDFGSANFRGSDRWLEIQVRTNLGGFSALSPRQPLTPAPYAVFAQTAGTVTNNSVTAAHIASGQVVKSLNGLKDSVNLVAGSNVTVTASGNDLTFSTGPWSANGSNAVYSGGNVGIGIATPARKLHVIGDVLMIGNVETSGDFLMGLGGAYKAVSSEEYNLRIVRGSIDSDGRILDGSGFTVTHPGTGHWIITINNPFLQPPTVTATARTLIGGIYDLTYTSADVVANNSFEVWVTGKAADTLVDAPFYFIAIGPR